MGAVTFSIDPKLIEVFKKNLNLDVFIETGTFKGEAIDQVKNDFKEIFSIELSNEYFAHCTEKFRPFPHVKILHGNSAEMISTLMPSLKGRPAIYWLDAHWCVATNTAGELSQCPLIGEIKSIQEFHPDGVILIDDARLFLAAPPAPHEIAQWPNLSDIVEALLKLSSNHNLTVLNDCIIFYPKKIEDAMRSHAHHHGIDWLNVLDKSRDYDKLIAEMHAKEREIKLLKKICDEREEALQRHSQSDIGSFINPLFQKIETKLIDLEENYLHTKQTLQAISQSSHIDISHQQETIKALQDEMHHLESVKQKIQADYVTIARSNQKILDIQREISHTCNQAILELQANYETIIKKQNEVIRKFERWTIKGFLKILKHKINVLLTPKLGELNMYPPKPINIPEHYKKNVLLKSTPRISIVTPGYNHGNFLERTILSIIQQEYPNLEYIIQDGGSKDNTIEILKKYDHLIKHWESIKDQGQSHAINLGFRHSTGEIMAYLNSDDLLLPGTLNYVANFFANNPKIDVIYGHRILVDEFDREIGRWILPPHDNDILSWADYIPQETLFWRRSIWDKIGGYIDESFRFAMDWDLILRFRDARANFARVPRFLGAFRIHPHQKTSSEISQTGMEEMKRLRERCHNRTVEHSEIHQAIRKYLNKHVFYHKMYQFGLLKY